MSYRCPKCDGTVFDRTNYICPRCGEDLPPELLFRPPGMPEFAKLAEGRDRQVLLLSQTLFELRSARGHSEAVREAVIRYFRTGISQGFKIPDLLPWLFFWPDNRWSVFAQVGFSAKEGNDFVQMVKGLTPRDLAMGDT